MPTKKTIPAKLVKKAPAKLAKSGSKALAPLPKTKGWVTEPKPFTSWSYSRYMDWDKCPRFGHWKHILKFPEGPKNEAMERGIFIAKQEEDYFLGKARGIPPDVHKVFHQDFKFAKEQKSKIVEAQWGFSFEWEPVGYFDWGKCKLRTKVDVGWQDTTKNIIHLRDNKTGKFREKDNDKYELQLELYVASGAAQFPTAKAFTSQLWYTDLGIKWPEEPKVILMAEAKVYQKEWDKRIKPMFADRSFRPKPGFYCSWCPYSKSQGGKCEY